MLCFTFRIDYMTWANMRRSKNGHGASVETTKDPHRAMGFIKLFIDLEPSLRVLNFVISE